MALVTCHGPLGSASKGLRTKENFSAEITVLGAGCRGCREGCAALKLLIVI